MDATATRTEVATLVDLLRMRAEVAPDGIAYRFLADGQAESGSLTYAELDERARGLALRLSERCAPGEPVALLCGPGLAAIIALFGCLYAGAIPVPAYPPRPNRPLGRLATILTASGARTVIADEPVLATVAQIGSRTPQLAAVRWVSAESVTGSNPASWRAPDLAPSATALIQYTSGSVSAPRGVVVSHANLLANQAMICRAFGHDAQTVFVGWLPLHHDMGLIGNVLQPLYLGVPAVLMPPTAFVQQPLRWLQAIDRYGATTSGGPDSAFTLCVERTTPEQRAALNLRSWRVAFNGAEPVRATTLERFAAAFAPAGFDRNAFYPCYGLAEATLLVAGSTLQAPPVIRCFDRQALAAGRALPATGPAATRLVACDQIAAGQTVAIVDPVTRTACQPDQIGEIWLAGPNIGGGYWGAPEASAATFGAHTATGAGPYLRTGDLGFLQDGALFVNGRLKELLIVHGANHYPHDIEVTAEQSHAALRAGFCAACMVEGAGADRLLIVCELRREAIARIDLPAIVAALRQALAEEHGLQLGALALLRTGALPRTTSGKIMRRACAEQFLAGTLGELARWESGVADQRDARPVAATDPQRDATALTGWLVARLAAALGIAPTAVDPHAPLRSYALGSLAAVGLAGELTDLLGRALPATLFYDYPTVDALARELTRLAAIPVMTPSALPTAQAQRVPAIPSDRSRTHTAAQLPHARHLRAAVSPVLALQRTVAAAELALPVIERADGGQLWDIDGNAYIDLDLAGGSCLFGHRPAWLTAALTAQLGRGIAPGSWVRQAGLAAELLCDLTGAERVTFVGGVADARRLAVQLARATTGRTKALLIAETPGWNTQGDLEVLDPRTGNLADRIASAASHTAAVIVEPTPTTVPLLALLARTAAVAGALLIVDETRTGLRLTQRGVQGWCGVDADLAVYGSVISNGCPIGALAGRAAVLDAIDGGIGKGSTCRAAPIACAEPSPLGLAAANATLLAYKEAGPALQQQLDQRAARLAAELTAIFAAARVAVQLDRIGSLLWPRTADQSVMLTAALYANGVYTHADQPWALGEPHGVAELNAVVAAVQAATWRA